MRPEELKRTIEAAIREAVDAGELSIEEEGSFIIQVKKSERAV